MRNVSSGVYWGTGGSMWLIILEEIISVAYSWIMNWFRVRNSYQLKWRYSGKQEKINNVLTCSPHGRCSINSFWPLGDHLVLCTLHWIAYIILYRDLERQQDASNIRVLWHLLPMQHIPVINYMIPLSSCFMCRFGLLQLMHFLDVLKSLANLPKASGRAVHPVRIKPIYFFLFLFE